LVVELPEERFGDVAWLLPERAREHHRGVRRPVTERGIARALEDRVEVVGRTDSAGRALQFRAQLVFLGRHSDFGLGFLDDVELSALGLDASAFVSGFDVGASVLPPSVFPLSALPPSALPPSAFPPSAFPP